MSKTILVTGATDGIGLLTAKKLAAKGHRLLLHGRSDPKLRGALDEVGNGAVTFKADLSDLSQVATLADEVKAASGQIDVLINNAGVFKTPAPVLASGLDVRFVVNTIAPYILTQSLLPAMPSDGRVINLSSAAQAPVDLAAMRGDHRIADMDAYAQSKLAITAWTWAMAQRHPEGPVFVAVNPGSLLASKMVKDGFGVAGNDLSIGADILCRAALDDDFAEATGMYFDNDARRFAPIKPSAIDASNLAGLMATIEKLSD